MLKKKLHLKRLEWEVFFLELAGQAFRNASDVLEAKTLEMKHEISKSHQALMYEQRMRLN